jgi:hypothetical protein
MFDESRWCRRWEATRSWPDAEMFPLSSNLHMGQHLWAKSQLIIAGHIRRNGGKTLRGLKMRPGKKSFTGMLGSAAGFFLGSNAKWVLLNALERAQLGRERRKSRAAVSVPSHFYPGSARSSTPRTSIGQSGRPMRRSPAASGPSIQNTADCLMGRTHGRTSDRRRSPVVASIQSNIIRSHGTHMPARNRTRTAMTGRSFARSMRYRANVARPTDNSPSRRTGSERTSREPAARTPRRRGKPLSQRARQPSSGPSQKS